MQPKGESDTDRVLVRPNKAEPAHGRQVNDHFAGGWGYPNPWDAQTHNGRWVVEELTKPEVKPQLRRAYGGLVGLHLYQKISQVYHQQVQG